MHRTHRSAGAWASVITLAIGLGVTPSAPAALLRGSESAQSRLKYSTSGSIGTNGLSGPGLVSFNSVADGEVTAPSSFSLGEFLLAGAADGISATYTDTPFRITYIVQQVDGRRPNPNTTPLILSGVLNGRVSGSGRSDVVATFDAVADPLPFQTGRFINSLTVLDPSLELVPATSNGGRTTAQAQVVVGNAAGTPPLNTPEPASLVVFLTSAVGLGLYRRFGRPAGTARQVCLS